MVVVAVDVGKNTVARSVTHEQRRRLLGPVEQQQLLATRRLQLGEYGAVDPPPDDGRLRAGT
jgi:hypothetical protein